MDLDSITKIMPNKDKIYNKKLHINHLLPNKSLDFSKIVNQQSKPQSRAKLDSQIQKLRFSLNKEKNLQSCVIRQTDNEANIIENYSKRHDQKMPKENNKETKFRYLIPKALNRYSSLIQQNNFTLKRELLKQKSAVTFRTEQIQKLNLCHQLDRKNKRAIFSFDDQILSSSDNNSPQSMTKVTSIVNLLPKKQNKLKRARKITAMSRYDMDIQNLRIAHKLLSIKPTKVCDLKEQKKFFKKQKYFKQLRSCSIEVQDPLNFNFISQSVSLPKINQRFHTIQH